MNDDTKRRDGAAFEDLVALIARLRAPGGCPWDREQTHESLKPNTIEEAYEVVEAIDASDDELCAELGDLLLQVVYHAQIAEEGGRFHAGDVIARVRDKMVRRHPHVFGDVKADSSSEVLRNWEAAKAEERAAAGKETATPSMLDGVSPSLPAVMEAYQMTTKVARVGFDWSSPGAVLGKVDEELAELRTALGDEEPDHRRLQDEIGDLLFTLVNVARLCGIDPEGALKSTNRKFRRRFSFVEGGLRSRGSSPAQSNIEEMEALWQEAKSSERG
jgi:tetrapyrrole methylase family protein / MazG family protein